MKASQINDLAGQAQAERYRLANAAEILELLGDVIGRPGQIRGATDAPGPILTDLELQQYGLLVEYMADQMKRHASDLGELLDQLEVEARP